MTSLSPPSGLVTHLALIFNTSCVLAVASVGDYLVLIAAGIKPV